MSLSGLTRRCRTTAAARFRFVALVVFIRPFCRARSLSAAVPDLYRYAKQGTHPRHFTAKTPTTRTEGPFKTFLLFLVRFGR